MAVNRVFLNALNGDKTDANEMKKELNQNMRLPASEEKYHQYDDTEQQLKIRARRNFNEKWN